MPAKKKLPDGRVKRVGRRIEVTVVVKRLDAPVRAHIAKHFPRAEIEALTGKDFALVFRTAKAARSVFGELFNDPNTEASAPLLDHLFTGSVFFDDEEEEAAFSAGVTAQVNAAHVKRKASRNNGRRSLA